MTIEQKDILFTCILILKGSARNEWRNLSENELLKMLENECGNTMETFWKLVDENKSLKMQIEELY